MYHNWAWKGLTLCKGIQKIGRNLSNTTIERGGFWTKFLKRFQIGQVGTETVLFNLQKSLIYQNFQHEKSGRMHAVKRVQWCPMVRDRIPMIWDITDLSNYSLDWHADLTWFDYYENSNVDDTKNLGSLSLIIRAIFINTFPFTDPSLNSNFSH